MESHHTVEIVQETSDNDNRNYFCQYLKSFISKECCKEWYMIIFMMCCILVFVTIISIGFVSLAFMIGFIIIKIGNIKTTSTNEMVGSSMAYGFSFMLFTLVAIGCIFLACMVISTCFEWCKLCKKNYDDFKQKKIQEEP